MSGMAGIGDVLEWARHQVVSRVPKADLDQRDPDYIRDQLPGLWLLASVYFRADVRGLGPHSRRRDRCCWWATTAAERATGAGRVLAGDVPLAQLGSMAAA